MIIVLFATELRPDADLADYQASSRRMNELVQQIPGFISVKGYTASDGDEVVIAGFESEEALDAWRYHPEYVATQCKGRKGLYQSYWVKVCQTVREYEFPSEPPN
jgi:heme-degrading monooxygenase HmoA